jgi:hypothetical protein
MLCALPLMFGILQSPFQSGAQDARSSLESVQSAFRTDRLSARQIKLWRSIRTVVLAPNRDGRPLHPTLHGLWRAVEQSGHAVFLELVTDKERCGNLAAQSVVEKLDPAGRKHSIRIRLYIPTIDRAYPHEQPPQDGLEFVPFAGLKHERRYAKVLGHELAHVANMITDPDYMCLIQEICAEQLAIATGVGDDGKPLTQTALQERWDRIWPRILESEKPALAAEAEIRRELLAAKKK